jgi:glycosyltransferase involved in cell wall biosynthesis
MLERQVLVGAVAVHMFFESEIADLRALAPRAGVIAVPTGFDIPNERWRGGGGYLAWVGRIDPVHKGLDLLVEAISRLSEADRPALRIRGYDYKGGVAALERLMSERGVGPWVRLEGPIGGNDKIRFLSRAEGCIHPSRWECHSIALLESLALGVPCLVSNATHIAEALMRSRAALLSAPSASGLASMLPRLGMAARSIAHRGRDLIAREFNWHQLMPRFQTSIGTLGLL